MTIHQTVFSNKSFQLPEIVQVGSVQLGGNLPVRIQSMTNTPTLDTKATVNQCFRLIEAGCELIRITAQNIQEAENLAVIKRELRKAGFQTPLIADVHFNPAVAESAARLVEKVRINPGNYIDNRILRARYSDSDYQIELERIAEKLQPLLAICKQYATALRIGTNHGSLSGRIVQRYGDTPAGMAESAMEFVRICSAAGFHNTVLSMKSSNVRVMVSATRILVKKMIAEKLQYPIHLGVTEAGNGMAGRIKSAAGIGTLLAEGIGDTIRVSLTEAPENEIQVAREIISFFSKNRIKNEHSTKMHNSLQCKDDFIFERRISNPVEGIGAGSVPVVLTGNKMVHTINEEQSPEGNFGILSQTPHIESAGNGINYLLIKNIVDSTAQSSSDFNVSGKKVVPVVNLSSPGSLKAAREWISNSDKSDLLPVILSFFYDDKDIERFAINATLRLAPLLNDGFCDGIYLKNNAIDSSSLAKIAFIILQATRARITQTEYIACPGCGRTGYDLEGALEKVKKATSHLKGLKIAVMGCIVNGPGEMADADYGYVGQGNGKVSLYRGKNRVKKNIPEENAVSELIDLMKVDGRWKFL